MDIFLTGGPIPIPTLHFMDPQVQPEVTQEPDIGCALLDMAPNQNISVSFYLKKRVIFIKKKER